MTTERTKTIKIAGAFDIILVAVLLCAAAAAYFLPRGDKTASFAVVTVSGEEYTRICFDEIDDMIRLSVNSVDIEITDGGARVVNSSCPDKTCVRTGMISRPGEAAVCVPEKVVIYIEGADDTVDGIAY